MPKSFQYKFHKGLEFYQPLPQSAGGFRLGSASKVAILGSHGTLAYTPWDDKSWALWAHAACRGDYRRTPDVFFDLHKLRIRYEDDELTQPKDRFKPYIHWLSRQLTPILMWERYPQVPAAVRYPHERILQ